ncbi:MAG: FKBP-type peptidyl-prolyl cis-trans isomerase [Balneolaceae bacterium]
MKLSALLLIVLFALLSACNTPGQNGEANLDSKVDSVGYSLGFFYGTNLANEGVTEVSTEGFVAGLQTGIDESEAQLTQEEMQIVLQTYQQEIQMQSQLRNEEEAAEEIEKGNEFLEENAQNDDVEVTESGLQYRVIEEGSGDSPSETSEVEVHYRGTLVNGEEFDSSYERGETVTFPLNGVIPGWTEGVQLMTEGSTYEFFIPGELGYGNNPPPGSIIKPGSVLIFEVELIDVKE